MNDYTKLRKEMVKEQIAARGIHDPAVLKALEEIPREEFVSPDMKAHAYSDSPLSIGEGQTISQPYIVALMTEAMALSPSDRILEIGTGSGFGAAVLSRIASEVYTVERLERLAQIARDRLKKLGYTNVHVLHGNGTLGWPRHAPYDAIVVTACARGVPRSLLDQLTEGGRMVIPVGAMALWQKLVCIRKTLGRDYEQSDLGLVSFVPLVGAAGWREDEAEMTTLRALH